MNEFAYTAEDGANVRQSWMHGWGLDVRLLMLKCSPRKTRLCGIESH